MGFYIYFAYFILLWSNKSAHGNFQYFGSGSELDPDSHESVDPDPDPGWLKRPTRKEKSKDLFEVLDVLFGALDDSLVA
jgi:hypothetical protein